MRSLICSALIDGDGAHNAFPGYTVTGEGNLLAFYRKGATHLSFDGRLYWGQSADGGETWSTELLLEPLGETGGAPNNDIRDVGAVTLRSGRIVVVFDQRARADSRADATSWVIHSDDHGQTWSVPRRLEPGFPGGNGAFEAAPLELADGTMIVPGHGADRPDGQLYIRLMRSGDAGETWQDTGVMIASPDGNVWNEPCLCALADDRILMLIRDETSYSAHASWSSDRGSTWTAPVPVLPRCNSRPACIWTPDDDLVVLYRNYGKPWPTIASSTDGGMTWSDPAIWSQPGSAGSFTYAQWQIVGARGTGGMLTAVIGQERRDIEGPCDVWFLRFTAPDG